MQSQTCSCKQGFDGKICKHLIGCSIFFNKDLLHLPSSTASSRQKLAMIAHGSCENMNFYSFDENAMPVADDLHTYKDDGTCTIVTQPSNDCDCMEQRVSTDSDEEGSERIQKARVLVTNMTERLLSVIQSGVSDNFVQILSSLEQRYDKCSSESDFESLLLGLDSQMLQRNGGSKRMHVQPTAPSRGPVASLNVNKPKKRRKKKHSLNISVASNSLNATKH